VDVLLTLARTIDRLRDYVQNAGLAGGVAEWLNALVLKTSRAARFSWVRILPPPPFRPKHVRLESWLHVCAPLRIG
jgi:hypothetical protein